MSKIEKHVDPRGLGTTITATFGDDVREYDQVNEAVRVKIVDRLVNAYLDTYADEILASIDLEAIKKKTNDKVTVQALRELLKS